MNEIKLKRFSADYCNPHSFRMVETIDGPWCHYAEVSRLLDVLGDQLRRSEEDLRRRGPGDIWGIRQHGLPGIIAHGRQFAQAAS